MRVTVDQLTFDDFKEAAAAVRDAQVRKQQKQARRSPATFLWMMAVAVVVFWTMTFSVLPIDPFAHQRPPQYLLISFILPLACLLMLVLVAVAAQRSSSAANMLGKLMISLIPLAVIIPVLAALWWLTRMTAAPRAQGQPRDWYGTLLPHVCWVLIGAMLIVLTVRAMKSQLRQAWEGQPSVARPKVFEITSAGVTIDEGVVKRAYAWLGFTRFLESSNLLILCPSDITFEVIPKRAFADAADLDAVRALLTTEIRAPGEQPAAFPVVLQPSPSAPQRVG
jgi:hypothetical protein